jgi:hypothetical protein
VGYWAGLDGFRKYPPPGFDPRKLQPVASCCMEYAIPTPRYVTGVHKNLKIIMGSKHVRLATKKIIKNL